MQNLIHIQKLMRVWILEMTTKAGSGHPTSSLSALEAMSVLMFGREESGDAFFHFDVSNPENPANDRLIFSKGHASPLYYTLWAAASAVREEELMTFRQFESVLEGHPTRRFPLTEVPTGSLGQGLSVGVGEALAIKKQIAQCTLSDDLDPRLRGDDINRDGAEDGSVPRVFVLLGDSEMAEGQVWEAMEVAAYYKLNNLVAIVDVNRLGQRGVTMLGYDVETYRRRAEAFGWCVVIADGHDNDALAAAYTKAMTVEGRPIMIVAQTVKGKGVSFLEGVNGWHGKTLSVEELEKALAEIGAVDRSIRGILTFPKHYITHDKLSNDMEGGCVESKRCEETGVELPEYVVGEKVAPRVAYGDAIAALARADSTVVALDAETSNSTKTDAVKKDTPAQFYEMFIAEQNMVSVAVGMARRGLRPFVSTFAAFLTRAADQIRMAQYADVDVTFVGSHCGVSIGADGASQMGLEDLALFGALRQSVILYPSDATSASMLTVLAQHTTGLSYVRTTREDLPVLYSSDTEFAIGGSQTLRSSQKDTAVVFAAGITVHEALAAADMLAKEKIAVHVVDCYSICPLDVDVVRAAAQETGRVVVVEDHHAVGGLGTAVYTALSGMAVTVTHLCVRTTPRSGATAELLAHEGIDAASIVAAVKSV